MRHLFILEIKPLLVASFEDISSQSIGFLFVWYGFLCSVRDFAGGSDGKASAYNAGDPGSVPGRGGSPEKAMAPTPVLSPGKSHGQRSLVGSSPWSHKESDTTE